jgi:hypothetical protein
MLLAAFLLARRIARKVPSQSPMDSGMKNHMETRRTEDRPMRPTQYVSTDQDAAAAGFSAVFAAKYRAKTKSYAAAEKKTPIPHRM